MQCQIVNKTWTQQNRKKIDSPPDFAQVRKLSVVRLFYVLFRYRANTRATFLLLQGLLSKLVSLISHHPLTLSVFGCALSVLGCIPYTLHALNPANSFTFRLQPSQLAVVLELVPSSLETIEHSKPALIKQQWRLELAVAFSNKASALFR